MPPGAAATEPTPETPGGLRHVPAANVSRETAQSAGMQRATGVSGALTGATGIYMGTSVMPPGSRSAAHHHGHSETAIYVVSGSPAFLFRRDGQEQRIQAAPGDFVYVPPFVPHIEENPSETQDAVVVLARTTQEAIVEHAPGL